MHNLLCIVIDLSRISRKTRVVNSITYIFYLCIVKCMYRTYTICLNVSYIFRPLQIRIRAMGTMEKHRHNHQGKHFVRKYCNKMFDSAINIKIMLCNTLTAIYNIEVTIFLKYCFNKIVCWKYEQVGKSFNFNNHKKALILLQKLATVNNFNACWFKILFEFELPIIET